MTVSSVAILEGDSVVSKLLIVLWSKNSEFITVKGVCRGNWWRELVEFQFFVSGVERGEG
jgi:hypothetical protein